jgi:hypothetical protein
MPTDTNRSQDAGDNNGVQREDEPIPTASEDKVLEETARLAREGRKELESDPRERKPASD